MDSPSTTSPHEPVETEIWEDDDSPTLGPHVQSQGSSSGRLAAIEYGRMVETFHQAGYREGLSKGKLVRLQAGFDKGYGKGSQLGKELGILRGQASGILSFLLAQRSVDMEDPRINRVRNLISDLNRCDPLPECIQREVQDSKSQDPSLEDKGLDKQNINQRSAEMNTGTNGQVLFERCKQELDALLMSIGFYQADM
ncbi:hypothetical protein CROQUDRAFT_163815 [Cronartium quercuum f. sp. fusiforme G11]|uniref:Protein YAE1 n=1 Tax=Cronartium quercuum f. sp. fusiforme G11 TaxID=708437 RepID=A0A9P6NDB5_9BASI|nr:hypothetical protein CROQUDRAFT_163815 [Cronartium quercuum f. sp. fusiforme G11]